MAVLCAAVLIVGAWGYTELHEQRLVPPTAAEELSEGPFSEVIEILAFGAAPALVFGLIGGAIVTRRALAPLTLLAAQLEQTHVGNLNEAVRRTGNGDEVDRLTQVFNALKRRIAKSLEHTREFTLHASHELKTPLTVMHATLEQALAPEATLPGIQERCRVVLEEVQRLSVIVTQLSFLARADEGQLALQCGAVQLDELVSEAVEDATLLAAQASITVTTVTREPCTMTGDRMRLRQLLLVILDNAVKHNLTGGKVRVSVRAHNGTAEVSVANTGTPMPMEERQLVFDRFYRGATAVDAAIEGSGLGLSIAESIVRAHGGTINFSTDAEGLHAMRVVLPCIVA